MSNVNETEVKLFTLSELRELTKNLTIFYDTFNQRPISVNQAMPQLFYSEKLISKFQLHDYEKSCIELRKALSKFDPEHGTCSSNSGDPEKSS